MSGQPAPWPEALAGTPAVSVIDRAIARQRLGNSLLLFGENLGTLANVAHGIADRLLNDPRQQTQYFPPKQHPDFFALRPAGKSRQIGVDDTRHLIGLIQKTPQVSHRKVAVIYEADRMGLQAANVFLKTLEEPPASTNILLLTTRPYSLLPTIRSRCLHFRFTDRGHEALADSDAATRERWASALKAYTDWLGLVVAGSAEKRAVATQVMGIYGLITRFNAVLAAATEQVWDQQKEKLPADLDDEERAAVQTGIVNGIRLKLIAEIERATGAFARLRLGAGDESARIAATSAIRRLEQDVGLLRLNLNEAAVLEDFLLASLRFWSRKQA